MRRRFALSTTAAVLAVATPPRSGTALPVTGTVEVKR